MKPGKQYIAPILTIVPGIPLLLGHALNLPTPQIMKEQESIE